MKKVKSQKKSKPKKSPAKVKSAKPKSTKPKQEPRPKKAKAVKLDPSLLRIRDRLFENRAEVLKMIASSQAIERDVGDLTFSNEIDLASNLEGREMIFQLSSRDRHELKLIEDTLFKIQKGAYGICESCSKRIGMKRLQILPLTKLCIDCQESMELG